MVSVAARAPLRRAPAPPPALPGELVRSRLLSVLAPRFVTPVTVVVAGAGFGKTTLLAQALRANQTEPHGIDAWVACEPGDEDAGRLSQAIAAALGGSMATRDPCERVLDALRAQSPIAVCLVLDDLHQLPSGSTSSQLLADVVRRLPANAHLLLASREPVALPLAKRRAAGEVVELDVDQLAFTPAEAEALARGYGEGPARVDGLAGWPSLVRLALSAPPGAERQFLWEEVVAGLSPQERAGLLALATVGWGSSDDVERVAGVHVEVDHLAAVVPLVRQDGQGHYGAHELWEDAVERLYPAREIVEVRERALQLLAERGETVRTGSCALRWGADDALRVASRRLVRESFGAVPADTVTRWLDEASEQARAAPELRLLELALRHSSHIDDRHLDVEVDELAAEFALAGDDEGHAVTLALGTVIAHFRGDEVRLFGLAERVRGLPGADKEPILRFLTGAVDAALAALTGDVDLAIQSLEALSFTEVPPSATELVTRLRVAMLILDGRADEAVVLSEQLAGSPSAYVRGIQHITRWAAGDPSGYRRTKHPMAPATGINERDGFYHAAYGSAVAASFGDLAALDALRPVIDKVLAAGPDARDSAIAATATAARQVASHDEVAAGGTVAEHLARYPLTVRLAEVHLKRLPAVAYVLSPLARERWEAASLGPAHERAIAVARVLLASRRGELSRASSLPSTEAIFTALPLSWSVELAVRAELAGCRDGRRLAGELADWTSVAVRAELERRAAGDGAQESAAAASLLDAVPDPGRARLRIEVLGEVRVLADGEVVEADELRRHRVRALLALLALDGPMRREQVTDVLWPDLAPAAAGRNLRVTLSRLRRLLEPMRAPGRQCSSLRADGESIGLAAPPHVEVDLWDLRRHLDEAQRARRAGDSPLVAVELELACELWRGDPLVDLEPYADLAGRLEQLRDSLVEVTLQLGELRLVAGRFDEAVALAERARSLAPYTERAHRLLVAAHLQRHDRVGVARAVRDLQEMLAELGVEAESATQMLVRQAARQAEPGLTLP